MSNLWHSHYLGMGQIPSSTPVKTQIASRIDYSNVVIIPKKVP